ncbi:hypothetical protein BDE02_02G128300 [Populus trichocarpa]|nr:hypothetical protein BDE02_02G128300 [Populus trichocarpa]
MGPAQPQKKKKSKESGRIWALGPAGSNYVLLRVCLAKHTLMPDHNFYVYFSLIFGQIIPFFISENSKNIWGSLLIYLWAPHTLIYFFSSRFVFFLAMCSICDLLLLNTNMSCNIFLFPSKKSK